MKAYKFETLGVMLDMSRNAVMNVPTVKKYMSYLKKMGYNCLLLYIEDTYEVPDEPYLGYMRGRYSQAELREIDDYAASLGMELIPCIQTLAHLQGFVPWKQVPIDSNDTMLVGDERVYKFISHILDAMKACFRSKLVHIGMDEAWDLGRGKYMNLHGYEDPTSIMKKHLARVCEIVREKGLEPMIWSDMFFRCISGNNKYYLPRMEMPRESREALPADVIPVYWDYYHSTEQEYDDMLYNHEQLSDKNWFAGGVWTWRGFLPSNEYSIETMRPALDACRKHGIKHVFFTMWGDDGAECSRWSVMPALYYLAQYAKGVTDEEKICRGFARLFGMEFEEFSSIDQLNKITKDAHFNTDAPAKLALYNDYFLGVNDIRMIEGGKETAKAAAEHWRAIAKKHRKWARTFESAAALADVLAVKYDLGLRTRAAYLAGDKATLEALARNEYTALIRLIDRFARLFERQWFDENKPHGFDVQDVRLGGLIRRTEACRRRLLDYAAGKIGEIPELGFELLTDVTPQGARVNYGKMVTPNRLTHRIL